MSDRASSSARVVWLVAHREIVTRMGSKAFRIVTAIMLAILVIGVIVIKAVGGGGTSADKVGLTPQTAPLASSLRTTAEAVGVDVAPRTVPSQAVGEQQVRDGDLDALLVGTPDAFRALVKQDIDSDLQGALNVLARQRALDRQITASGGDPAKVNAAVGAAHVAVTDLEPETKYHDERLAIGVVVGVIIYISLLTYGQTVAQGVVEEKTSRVVELLLSTIRAWQLMAGKVLGIGLVGLTQLAILLVAGAVVGLATGVLSLPGSVAVGIVLWSIAWYLLGFFLYALLFAAAGALVSRQEDVGAVSMPLMMLIIVPSVVGISTLPANPDSPLVGWMSVIPLFSPTLMPMRLAMGVAPAWEAILAVVLTIALIAALVGLTGRVYRNAVMRVGARVRLRDALRAA
jgi:ABC-2 type transport system permease protein